MPRPGPITKVVIAGTAPEGDIFNTGYWISHTNAFASQAALQTFLNAELSTAHTVLTSLAGTLLVDGSSFDKITMYYHATDGDTPATYQAEGDLSISASGTQSLPNQASVVATLLTGIPGRRARGRMYWPCWKPTISDGTAQLTDSVITAVATQTAALLQAWNTTVDAAVVTSSVASHSWAITTVSVDSRVDIQRRRANRQTIRNKVTHAVPPE